MLTRLSRHPWSQALLIIAIAALVYLPFLGVKPLDFSEGHRAVPGWTMLESHDFWHQKMFGLTYIRKPPGMSWAIAASSSILGKTPLAARLPSALSAMLMGLTAWWYGRRWFGSAAGLRAGLAQVLMPLMWAPGRSAEIEMLNNLGTQLAALGLVDLLARPPSRGDAKAAEEGPFGFLRDLCASARDILLPTCGLLIAALAKGPASAPVLIGVFIGACIAARSLTPLRSRGLWLALLFGASAIALLGMKFLLANNDPNAVREDVAGQFLWSREHILGVLTLAPLALASALPMSLALFAPMKLSGAGERDARLARTLACSWWIALVVLLLGGVHNPRYAMPAGVLLPPLVAFVLMRLERIGPADPSARAWRTIALGKPWRWAAALGMGAWWCIALTGITPTRDQLTSQMIADRLAHDIDSTAPAGDVHTIRANLWADDAIEARPDILWRAQQVSPLLTVTWAKSQLQRGELPPPGTLLLLRSDPRSAEANRYAPAHQAHKLELHHVYSIRSYEFTLYRCPG